jgi:hypothetical protein
MTINLENNDNKPGKKKGLNDQTMGITINIPNNGNQDKNT